MKSLKGVVALLAVLMPTMVTQASTAVDRLLTEYRNQGASQFDVETGRQLWTKSFISTKSTQPRSCASCHSAEPRDPGRHVRTGKTIAPLAPSVNTKRLTDEKQIRKWLMRNCKWTLGRECSADEKAAVLVYLQSL